MRVIWLRCTALRRTRLIIYSCHAPWCRLQMNALKNDEVEKSAGNLCACKLLSFFFVSTGTITCARGCQNFRWPSKTFFIRTIYFKFPPLDVAEILKRGR
jgi:hypothetical protein